MALSSVVVTIEKPSKVSLVEINGSDSTLLLEKQNAFSPKQFTWFLFLKAHRVFGSLSWLPMASKTMVSSVKKYIALSDVSEEEAKTKRLYIFIKDFLFISALALVLEVVAHLKKMEFVHHSAMRGARSPAMSLDRLVLCLGCFWIKFKNLKPRINGGAYEIEDASSFPMVLVQVPMCNEREVTGKLKKKVEEDEKPLKSKKIKL
ncbi:hypothetical protein GQ457_05G027190 [Hibiscus cannabinus]